MSRIDIQIPKVEEKEVTKISSGDLGSIRERFEKIDNLLFAVTASVLISVVSVIIAVIGLFIDQMRYNNAAYREYSDKLNVTEDLYRTNIEVREQNNTNQEAIKLLLEEIKAIKKR